MATPATTTPSPNPPPVVKKLAPLPTKQEAMIRQALYEAQDAFARGRLVSPRHDNAYDGYRRVLALDPKNEAARTGIKHISSRYLSLAKAAQAEGDYEKALGFARQAQRVAPGYEGSAHMVQYLEQQYAKHQAQEMQQIKAGATQQPVTLNVKGNEYFLVTRDIAAHNAKAKMQLAEIAKKVREYDSRILIVASNDNDGRWIYSQMREALTDYRLRGNIKTDKQARIVLLDQPTATAQAAAVSAASAIVEVRRGHVRTPVPGQTVAAAFMTLYNTTDTPQQLVAVKGDVAQSLELHGHTESNGIMQMRQLDAIALPPHTEVTLAPGGMHLMLIGLHQVLAENQNVGIRLVLGDGHEVEATLPVIDVAHEQQDGGDAHHH